MERAMGEIFEFEGEKFKVVEGETCKGCAFKPKNKCMSIRNCLTRGKCTEREGENVIFVKIVEVENEKT